jgi:hypothetical protein
MMLIAGIEEEEGSVYLLEIGARVSAPTGAAEAAGLAAVEAAVGEGVVRSVIQWAVC